MTELASFSSGNYDPDRLVAGDSVHMRTQQITLITGQNLARGAVLGKITASGKYNLSLSAAGDGSQTPDAILAEACDATAADKLTIAYFTGDFNEAAVTIGTAHTADTIREGLRSKGIHLIKAVAP